MHTVKMAKKELRGDREQIENGPKSSTSIHGAVVTLSPVKKGRKSMFFDGMLADEPSQIRNAATEAERISSKNVPVEIANCEVKPARQVRVRGTR